jgi:hypothetical protein
VTFTAEAGRPYHVWIRGRADRDYYGNDSVHLQFSGAVSSSGAHVFSIGTTASPVVCIERGAGAGLAGWGWEDNGWDGLGPHLYFGHSGEQTIRVQRREDGVSVDQIVLSPLTFLGAPPGAAKGDSTIFPEHLGISPTDDDDGERVLYASRAALFGDGSTLVADSTAASGSALRSLDRGDAKVVTALAAPATYAEVTIDVEAGRGYRLWIRARAERNSWGNDSVHVQFSGSTDSAGNPVFRIGSQGSTVVNLEDCSGCRLSGWGWQDNGWGTGVMGPLVYFVTSGPQTLRIQNREDGIIIDQIVLSPSAYLARAPGQLKNDATILEEITN